MFALIRRARRLQWLLLALFTCSVGAAVAAPGLGSGGLSVLCAGAGGLKLVDGGDGPAGTPRSGPHQFDCPLCLPLAAPLPDEPAVAAPVRAFALRIDVAWTPRMATRALRPPARAPPIDLPSTDQEVMS